MATLRDIKKRIGTVKNTQKITKAMKMVAAAKLRRAQTAVMGSRPYAQKIQETLADLSAGSTSLQNNLLFTTKKEVKNVQLIIFSSNRGLCGGFNSNLLRRSEAFNRELKNKNITTSLTVIGRKGREFFKARHVEVDQILVELADDFSFTEAKEMAVELIDKIQTSSADEIYLIYNSFVSAMSQNVTIQKVLPVSLETSEENTINNFIFEPAQAQILETLVPRYAAIQLFKAHLESKASELGARMSAMDSATSNAREMISALTLKYNRARQAAITMELMDIVNGAEAIK